MRDGQEGDGEQLGQQQVARAVAGEEVLNSGQSGGTEEVETAPDEKNERRKRAVSESSVVGVDNIVPRDTAREFLSSIGRRKKRARVEDMREGGDKERGERSREEEHARQEQRVAEISSW